MWRLNVEDTDILESMEEVNACGCVRYRGYDVCGGQDEDGGHVE